MVLKLAASNQNMRLTEEVQTVEHSINYIKCKFDFETDDWSGTVKTAHFRNPKSGRIYSQVLENDECIVPSEAMADGGCVTFSVIGEKENYRITSSIVSILNKPAVYGGEPSDPTPSEYEQIIGLASKAVTAATEAESTAKEIKAQAESGAFKGEQGAPGADGKAATVAVGTVETAEPDTPASVTNSGTENAAVLDFVIPKGEQGDSMFTPFIPGEAAGSAYRITVPGCYCNTTKSGWVRIVDGEPFEVCNPAMIIYGLCPMLKPLFYIVISNDITLTVIEANKGAKEYKLSGTKAQLDGETVDIQYLAALMQVFYEFISPFVLGKKDELIFFTNEQNPHGNPLMTTALADSELSDTSVRPVQNKTVNAAVTALSERLSALGKWQKIAGITIAEDVAQIEITQDTQGKEFSVEKLVILIRGKGSAANTGGAKDFIMYTLEGSDSYSGFPYQKIFQPEGKSYTSLVWLETLTDSEAYYTYNGMEGSTPRPNSAGGAVQGAGISYSVGCKKISYIKIKCGEAGYVLGAGSTVEIWGQ